MGFHGGDWLGVNYYRSYQVGAKGAVDRASELGFTDMGWGVYPEGLFDVLTALGKKFHFPIYITENGLADFADAKRWALDYKRFRVWLTEIQKSLYILTRMWLYAYF